MFSVKRILRPLLLKNQPLSQRIYGINQLPFKRELHPTLPRKVNPLLPTDVLEAFEEEEEENKKKSNNGNNSSKEKDSFGDKLFGIFVKCLETGGIMFATVAVIAGAGLGYHEMYEYHVLEKIGKAFDHGDQSFDVTIHENATTEQWIERPQQKLMDDIISGKIKGRYFLVIGEKGTGKTSMILESFSKANGVNCTAMDAHADPEVFRLRIGKALNFEFFEDYFGSLFNMRGPRDTTPILDIERSLDKLEEVALKRRQKDPNSKPLILLINSAHLIKEDEEGINLVSLLQQKAEELSGAGLVTMIFNSDDYWLYERMRRLGTKLEVVSVGDLHRNEAVQCLKATRKRLYNKEMDDKTANEIYDLIGGRPQHLSIIAKSLDIKGACHELINQEKIWFLNKCGLLGEPMDDDVMESGKFSTSAMLLAKKLVEMDREHLRSNDDFFHDEHHELPLNNTESHTLASLPLWKARQVMTRPDYIQKYDDMNIFTIDSDSNVRADSVPMMRAFHEIVSEPGFDELLNDTIDRVAFIESLGRTREIVAKDLVLGGKYLLNSNNKESTVKITLQGGTREEKDQ